MKKLLSIIGARPQIIKVAAFVRAVNAWNNAHPQTAEQIRHVILHTGQHYDTNMSEAFFDELGIPAPDIRLNISHAQPASQISQMVRGIIRVLNDVPFDGVVIYGDTNSTFAGALAARHAQTPVFHIEAGLRSYNLHMPEEINRIVADALANILFTPTSAASHNLTTRNVIQTGDLMLDNTLFFSALAAEKSTILFDLKITPNSYALATIHRQVNTDNPDNLMSIIVALETISANTPIVLPLHPRTRSVLPGECKQRLMKNPRFLLIEPVSFLDMIQLEKNATIIITDSGGVQKEAFFCSKPCIVLREETEWKEIVEAGAAILAGANPQRIQNAFLQLQNKPVLSPNNLYGDGHAAEQMVHSIASFLGQSATKH